MKGLWTATIHYLYFGYTEFKRGHTYYEFTNDFENILEGKGVLLQEMKTEKWFRLDQDKVLADGIGSDFMVKG